MGNGIERVAISGLSVMGVQQYEYGFDGTTGALIDALNTVEMCNGDAVREAAQAISTSLRARMRKLDDLGWALGVLSGAQALLKDDKTSDIYTSKDLERVKDIAESYDLKLGFDTTVGSGAVLTKGDVSKALAVVQEEIDTENSGIQKSMQALTAMIDAQSIADQRQSALSNVFYRGIGDLTRNIE